MLHILVYSILAAALLLALDYYVYRNWRRYTSYRSRLRWTLPVYRVVMGVMAVAVPVYFAFSHWWEVEPKLLRAVAVGGALTYYIPKGIAAFGVLIKDLLKFAIWLFEWFQKQLVPVPAPEAAASVVLPQQPAQTTPLDLVDMKHLPRRDFLRQMGWTAATAPFVMVGYGVFKHLYDFEVYRIDVPIPGLPRQLEGLTIAQLSDLHAGSMFSERPMLEAADAVNSLQPDLIAVTGDFVNGDAHELPLITPGLRALRAELGIYGCLGNHDHYAQTPLVIDGIGTTPVDLLVNENRTLSLDGAKLHLVGTDNTGFHQHFADLPRAMTGIEPRDPDATTVLLAHDPTFWDKHVRPEQPNIDLMLCGHTHGGQIGVEVGPMRWSFARHIYPRWAGIYEEAQEGRPQFLYVNRGLGTVGPPVRLGIRPEVTLLTLRRA